MGHDAVFAGGEILATGGIREAYEHGRGAITVRGRAFIEDAGADASASASTGNGRTARKGGKDRAKEKASKPSIIITELPYQTNKAEFVAHVAEMVEEQKLTGASPSCSITPPLLSSDVALSVCQAHVTIF
jgi:DNA gyrase subunit A